MPICAESGSSSLPDKPHLDRRVWERIACELNATCYPITAGEGEDLPWPGILRDISPMGAGLVLRRPFEPGTSLAIQVQDPPSGSPAHFLARVVHVTRLPDEKWLLGCLFICELSPDDVQALLGHNVPNHADPTP